MNIKTDSKNQGKGGKYLTFLLNKEEYGIEILKVREIIGIMDITSVPNTPKYIKGVINLRGTVIPVIDLRLKFSMPEIKYQEETCIIVVSIKILSEEVLIGIIVDTVKEVIDIVDEAVDPAPSFGSEIKTDYIRGMGKSNDKVKILLNIDKVLNSEELEKIQNFK